ncbi:MAG: hypothetical protein NPIRA04_04810 [Nitrospirales bacterium]|nr:MAG: hypothetical protein NPIRA04_04810 [Nitrospirales bacterium]
MNDVDVQYYAPRFQIKINGSEHQADIAQAVLTVTVEQEINKTNGFRFDVQDDFIRSEQGNSKNGERFQWLGHDLFKYGNEVSIAMGYLDDVKTIVEGKIQKISARFNSGSSPSFTVEGSDSACEFLTLPSETKVFNEKKHSEMVEQIASEAKPSLRALVDDTEEIIPRKVKKGGESYIKFLLELAEANDDFEFKLFGNDLYFKKSSKKKQADFILTWGKNLINFEPTLDIAKATTEVVVKSWDPKGKKCIIGRAKAGEEEDQEDGKQLASQIAQEIYGDVVTVITDQQVRSTRQAKKIAKAYLEKAGDSLITARGETIGLPGLLPGICVELEGLGHWFSGKYYVEKVTHSFDQNGYHSTFEAKRNAL